MDVKIYSPQEAAFDDREISLTELPPVPDWVEEALLEAGGTCNGVPNVRIVSGLDPDVQEFVGGRWWLKYAFREHKVNEYCLLHKPDGSKQVLTKKEGAVADKSKKIQGIVTNVVDRQIKEFGIPRYFVEYYKPPEYYGSPEAWENVRWFKDDDNDGKIIDLMGEFPHEGRYETWFMLEEAVEENGECVATRFQPITEIVVELIKSKIEDIKNKTAAEQHLENREQIDAEYIQHQTDLKEEIKDIVADRIDRIID